MPQDGFAGITRTAIVQQPRVAVHQMLQSEAPQRRSAPFAARRVSVRSIVREFRAHGVQQQVGERMEGLVREFRKHGLRVGLELRTMAATAAGFHKSPRSGLDGRTVEVASGRDRQRALVLHDLVKDCVADFRAAAGGRRIARGLCRHAALVRAQ